MRLSEGPAYEALSDSTTLTKGQSGPQMALLDSQRALLAPKGTIGSQMALSGSQRTLPTLQRALSGSQEDPMRLSEEPISPPDGPRLQMILPALQRALNK